MSSRTPTFSDIKGSFTPGDSIWLLEIDEKYHPHTIIEIGRKWFLTDVGVVLYEDHGWLWRALEPKEENHAE